MLFKMSKLGYYLSVAYYDMPYRIFLSILVLKLILFTHIIGLEIESFFNSLGIVILILSISLPIRSKNFKLLYLFFSNLLCSLIFFTHSLYRSYFGDFASIYNLNEAYMLRTAYDSVIDIMGINIFFIVDFIFLPFLFSRLKFRHKFNISERINAMGILLLLALSLFTPTFIYNIRTSFNFFESSNRIFFVNHFGIFTYQFRDIYDYLVIERRKKQVLVSDINTIKDWFKEKGNKVALGNDLSGIGRGMNLIVIQVESLQNFVIGKSYNGREVTPNLNEIAKRGIYFNNVYDHTAAGGSSDATFLANASLYPIRKGAVSLLYPYNRFDSLPNVLKEHGYATAGMHAFKRGFWNAETFTKTLGFDRQFYEDNYIMTEKVGWGLSDKAFFSQSLEKILGLPNPFCTLLFTLTSHRPYNYVTADIDNFQLSDLKGTSVGHYMRSMHYVDSAIGEFLQKLSEYDLHSNTVIVIYGDHRARLPDDELKLIDINNMNEQRKIPLIISIPNRRRGDERETIGGLIDVAPTVCNILGVDISDKFFMGKDLAQRDSSFVVFRDGSYISNDGIINASSVKEQLMISDLIIEKDMIPLIRNGENVGN